MINTKRVLKTTLILAALLILTNIIPVKAESLIELPDLTGGDSPSEYVSNIRLLLLLTILSLLPSFIIMMTSFTRIIVTFSFFKRSYRCTAGNTKSNIYRISAFSYNFHYDSCL